MKYKKFLFLILIFILVLLIKTNVYGYTINENGVGKYYLI